MQIFSHKAKGDSRIFFCGECSNEKTFSFHGNKSHPSFSVFVVGYPLEATRVVPRSAAITHIFKMSCLTKVLKSVVVTVAVLMVYKFFGVLSRGHLPSYSMGIPIAPIYPNQPISKAREIMIGSSSFSSRTSTVNFGKNLSGGFDVSKVFEEIIEWRKRTRFAWHEPIIAIQSHPMQYTASL